MNKALLRRFSRRRAGEVFSHSRVCETAEALKPQANRRGLRRICFLPSDNGRKHCFSGKRFLKRLWTSLLNGAGRRAMRKSCRGLTKYACIRKSWQSVFVLKRSCSSALMPVAAHLKTPTSTCLSLCLTRGQLPPKQRASVSRCGRRLRWI